MAQAFEVFDGLAQQIPAIPAGSVVSRLVFANDRLKVMMLGFAPREKRFFVRRRGGYRPNIRENDVNH